MGDVGRPDGVPIMPMEVPVSVAAKMPSSPVRLVLDAKARRPVGPKADLMDGYLEMVSRIPLFTPAEERQAAKSLRELELEALRRVLKHRQSLLYVGNHPLICDLPNRGHLERVAANFGRIPFEAGTLHPLAADYEELLLQVRELDEDHLMVDGAVAALRHDVAHARTGGPTLADLQTVERGRRAALAARNAFVRANLRLVVSVARHFHHFRMPLIDLIQEGNLGLLKAVHRFDWKKGFRFSTYAHWWIRQSIERAIMNKGAQVRLPVHVFDTRRQIARAQKELGQELGRRPTPEEMAVHLGIDLEKVQETLAANPREPLSLDEPVGSEDDRRVGDMVADDSVAPPDEACITSDEVARVKQMLALLTPVEMDIIERRFGLHGDQDETLEEIGKRYNLSRERVRQIQVAGLEKMRRHCERCGVEG